MPAAREVPGAGSVSPGLLGFRREFRIEDRPMGSAHNAPETDFLCPNSGNTLSNTKNSSGDVKTATRYCGRAKEYEKPPVDFIISCYRPIFNARTQKIVGRSWLFAGQRNILFMHRLWGR